jgi:hypothetical protein
MLSRFSFAYVVRLVSSISGSGIVVSLEFSLGFVFRVEVVGFKVKSLRFRVGG